MPLARERSRIDAPSSPFLQKTSVAWVRISANRRSKRVAGAGAARGRRATETRAAVDGLPIAPVRRIIRTFVRTQYTARPAPISSRGFVKSIPSIRQQPLDLALLLTRERQQRQT